ncbi:lipopolysaccharide core heptose(II) kinase RfaY [Lentzea flaviverrucosa]|uniref:Lipopolysaccharide kinase (Kdo/WaaP) family protein n=1 Tax=Lentzea flaviverrucosa TaxID=200379 RepID=A0A1H9K0U2_9PSEU|nr:lipopolysaccharide core heptose(II) kinase RfaY [Lentzea flaviverrucosa]RDI26708.1 lipopolysaccharide kinase (Kdo/WaaP) family protein [Lentzea flaviverrucosa]SEQ92871.1 Lipopolysaccharide kinase (Kdo/WaaP) family protein [Lentzea flaviverrucosa]
MFRLLETAVRVEPLEGEGLTNVLHLVTLADGRKAVLRQPKVARDLPKFVIPGAPEVLAHNGRGDVLVEYVEGRTLADALPVSEEVWRRIGEAFAKVHAVGLLHNDVNLYNIIVREGAATLIDWDNPGLGNPLDELAAFEEHLYLHGTVLPQAFWIGYGSRPDPNLLRVHRIAGCIAWLASSDWRQWEADRTLKPEHLARVRNWRRLLAGWLAGQFRTALLGSDGLAAEVAVLQHGERPEDRHEQRGPQHRQ